MQSALDNKKHGVIAFDQYEKRIDIKEVRMAPHAMNGHSDEEDKLLMDMLYWRWLFLSRYSTKGTEVLYHYTSPSAALSILSNSKQKHHSAILHFTRFDSLNDKNEQQEILEFLHKYCKKKLEEGIISHPVYDLLMEMDLSDKHMIRTYIKGADGAISDEHECKRIDCDVYLCCFSEADDLLPMWNYYSKSSHYEGYCIGFSNKSFQELKTVRDGYDFEVYKVIYSAEEKEKLFDEFIIPFVSQYDGGTEWVKMRIEQQIREFLCEFQFLFKNEAFEHEKELRAILYIPKNCHQKNVSNGYVSNVQYRASHGYIIPYVACTCPENSVVSVKVAPLLERELAEKNLTEYLTHMGYDVGPDAITVDSSSIPIRF